MNAADRPEEAGRSEAGDRVFARDALAARVAELRASGARVVFTNGCFDLLHVGHVRYLKAARALGDALVVAANSDASIRRLKGPTRPILPEAERVLALAALACVDAATLFDEDTPHALLELLRPDVLVKGATYSVEGVVGREVVEAYGGEVRTVALTEGRSTTDLLAKMTR